MTEGDLRKPTLRLMIVSFATAFSLVTAWLLYKIARGDVLKRVLVEGASLYVVGVTLGAYYRALKSRVERAQNERAGTLERVMKP